MGAEEIIAESHFAFLNQENETALRLAKEAEKLEPGNPDAFKAAGNALLSLDRLDEAIESYSRAVNLDPSNGDRHYDLGFAQASAGKLADALASLTAAAELRCSTENLSQLYTLLGIICFDADNYKDALINFEKAEQLTGIDTDILQRKAVIHGILGNTRSGLRTANQIKMISPSRYTGYRLAFNLMMQAGRLEEARQELVTAGEFTDLPEEYYSDWLTLLVQSFRTDADKSHLFSALEVIERKLAAFPPSHAGVAESCINAAEILLELGLADEALECVRAAMKPAAAFNAGIRISPEPGGFPAADSGSHENVAGSEESESGDSQAVELPEYLSPLFDEEGEAEPREQVPVLLDEEIPFELSSEELSQITRLSVGAYTLKRDFAKVAEQARLLQKSQETSDVYLGLYAEANALREQGSLLAEARYKEAIRRFRNAMIANPADILAVTTRIQCCIDIRDFRQAEELCILLSKDARDALLGRINEARAASASAQSSRPD